MLICITMQRKVEKIQRQKSKLELELPQKARVQKTSSVPERSNHYIILSIVYFIYYTARRLIDEAEN